MIRSAFADDVIVGDDVPAILVDDDPRAQLDLLQSRCQPVAGDWQTGKASTPLAQPVGLDIDHRGRDRVGRHPKSNEARLTISPLSSLASASESARARPASQA